MRNLSALLISAALISCASTALASALEDRMERDLEGAWATLRVEIYSNCSGAYNDNHVNALGVAAKADRRFEPGEVVKIDRVKVKRSRVDLLLTLPSRSSKIIPTDPLSSISNLPARSN